MGSYKRFSAAKEEKNSVNSFSLEQFGFEIRSLMSHEIQNRVLVVLQRSCSPQKYFKLKKMKLYPA